MSQDPVAEYEQRQRLVLPALLVGLAAGAVAIVFRDGLEQAHRWRDSLAAIGWWLIVPLGAMSAAASVWLVRQWAPEASGSGIPHVERVLHGDRELRPLRVLVVKLFGGLLAMGGGLALGREGPTVQMGAALGRLVGGRGNDDRQRALIAAGAGAGLAAAFNAPLAGLLFVLEELLRRVQPTQLLAAFVACVAAVVMTRPVTGPGVIFQVAHHTEPPLTHLPRYLLLGLIAGLLGVVFDKCLMAGLDLFERIPSSGRVAAAGGVGAIMGVTAWWWPPLVGGGEGLAQASLRGELAISWLPMLLVVRLLLTVLSYGCGAPGGIFAPLLVLGALLGLGYAAAIGSPDGAGYAVVGMAAIFTAVVRAPLTGIVLIVEMTANYDLLLPMLVASLAAYRVADHLHDEPIYEALSARDRPRPSV